MIIRVVKPVIDFVFIVCVVFPTSAILVKFTNVGIRFCGYLWNGR